MVGLLETVRSLVYTGSELDLLLLQDENRIENGSC